MDCSRQYLNTHKPKEDRWLKAHPNVHLHFIPTHSSWLNQVECWFSILSWIRVVSRGSPPSIGIFECGRFPEVVV
jgi:transposase